MEMGSFDIDNAYSVDEAFKKLSSKSYDVVISDYEMPVKNGLDFLKELKEQQRDIAFILFTGKGREEVAVEALNLGADRYINKNGSPETVYGELADAINKDCGTKEIKKTPYRIRVKVSTTGRKITSRHNDCSVFSDAYCFCQ